MKIDAYQEADQCLTPRDYEQVLKSQSACNLLPIVKEFAGTLNRIWDEARGRGTDWVGGHPICVLYATQVADLTGGFIGRPAGYFQYDDAHEYCRTRAALKTEEKPIISVGDTVCFSDEFMSIVSGKVSKEDERCEGTVLSIDSKGQDFSIAKLAWTKGSHPATEFATSNLKLIKTLKENTQHAIH